MDIMYSEFAYSRGMQLILMFFAFAYNFVVMYFIAKLLLRIYGESVSAKNKALFAFLAGTILQSALIYVIYFIGGMVSFTKVQNLIFASPNPITALLYCYLGIKLLKLSPKRSIELMGHVYLYFMILIALNRLTGGLFFKQDTAQYNYMMDAARHLLNLLLSLILYYLTCQLLKHKPALTIASKTYTFANPRHDLLIFFMKAIFIYSCVVLVPILVSSVWVANILVVVILLFFFFSTILYSVYQHEKAGNRNKDAYINSLIKSSDEFRRVKHDFYNILQTYSGYLSIGDIEACKKYHDSLIGITTYAGEKLELSRRTNENPTLVTLLMDKQVRAENMGIHMGISLKCILSDLAINEIDLSRALSCLLDNAIEAACESIQKRVYFTIETKSPLSRLIIITNSTKEPVEVSKILAAGSTNKIGHEGIGLNNVRRIIDRYNNCTFKLNYYNNEVTAFLEIRQP